MILVGITGGSGTGKTTVLEIFKNNGADVIDADIVAKKIVEPGEPALEEIKDNFGAEYIAEDGSLLRRKLGSYVFSNSDKLKLLSKITHKYVDKYIDNYVAHCENDMCVIDAAALIESGIYKKCGFLISVIADKEIRIERIVARDNISKEEAKKRVDAQKKDEYYIEKSDYIVYNNKKTCKELEDEVSKIIKDIRRRA